ncbi:MAG: response regulator [Verrucomicrobia bacterium]|nr:response regulator [Verrucomicrobiota bacterium]
MRVLVADDQKSVGTSLAELVSECDHHVVQVVGSGLEAIQAYARHQPDVVVMDYRMPKLNGATACRYILANDPHARVILISGWASHQLNDFGALAVLEKPVTMEQLRAALAAAQPRRREAPRDPGNQPAA